MNYHDDALDPEPEFGYCEHCLDVALDCVMYFEDTSVSLWLTKCPSCFKYAATLKEPSKIELPRYEA